MMRGFKARHVQVDEMRAPVRRLWMSVHGLAACEAHGMIRHGRHDGYEDTYVSVASPNRLRGVTFDEMHIVGEADHDLYRDATDWLRPDDSLTVYYHDLATRRGVCDGGTGCATDAGTVL